MFKNLRFETRRNITYTDNRGIFVYHFIFDNENRPKGVVEADVIRLGDSNRFIKRFFRRRGFDNISFISDIHTFFPNGNSYDPNLEKNVRRGVGSRVLKYVVNDLKSRNVVGVYIIPSTTYMEKFLVKNEFILVGVDRDIFCKVI